MAAASDVSALDYENNFSSSWRNDEMGPITHT